MKRLLISALPCILLLTSCGIGAGRDKSFTLSGIADDTKNMVYFFSDTEVFDEEYALYQLDKETLEITQTDGFGRSVYVLGDAVYYNYGDCIAELGRGAVMGEYDGMYHFVLTDEVLYYPKDNEKTYMRDLDDYDDVSAGMFPVFDEAREDYYGINVVVLDSYEAYEYYVLVDGEEHYLMTTEEALAYNDGSFQLYDDYLYFFDGKKVGAFDLLTLERRELFAADELLCAAHDALYVRRGENLEACTVDGVMVCGHAGVFSEDVLVFIDSFEPVAYVIDRTELTAERLWVGEE